MPLLNGKVYLHPSTSVFQSASKFSRKADYSLRLLLVLPVRQPTPRFSRCSPPATSERIFASRAALVNPLCLPPFLHSQPVLTAASGSCSTGKASPCTRLPSISSPPCYLTMPSWRTKLHWGPCGEWARRRPPFQPFSSRPRKSVCRHGLSTVCPIKWFCETIQQPITGK